jgi:hypothetical protein
VPLAALGLGHCWCQPELPLVHSGPCADSARLAGSLFVLIRGDYREGVVPLTNL